MTEPQAHNAISNYSRSIYFETDRMYKWVIRKHIRRVSNHILEWNGKSDRIIKESIALLNRLENEYIIKNRGGDAKVDHRVRAIRKELWDKKKI